MPDKLTDYLEQVLAHVRWRRARPALREELREHLLEQLEDCRAAGMTEEDAAAETVRQMGDPAETGAALDGLHRPAPQWGLLALTVALALAGGFLRVWLTAGWRWDGSDPLRTVGPCAWGRSACWQRILGIILPSAVTEGRCTSASFCCPPARWRCRLM